MPPPYTTSSCQPALQRLKGLSVSRRADQRAECGWGVGADPLPCTSILLRALLYWSSHEDIWALAKAPRSRPALPRPLGGSPCALTGQCPVPATVGQAGKSQWGFSPVAYPSRLGRGQDYSHVPTRRSEAVSSRVRRSLSWVHSCTLRWPFPHKRSTPPEDTVPPTYLIISSDMA